MGEEMKAARDAVLRRGSGDSDRVVSGVYGIRHNDDLGLGIDG